MDLFDNLPEGMAADIDPGGRIIYIYQTPHSLIDCLDRLVSGWRDVVYVNVDAVFAKVRDDSQARKSLIQPLFAILATAQMNGFDIVAFHPAPLPPGTAVYRDSEGNIRPTLGFDPVDVTGILRPIIGISLGTDAEGRTRVAVTGTQSITRRLTVYIQSDGEEK